MGGAISFDSFLKAYKASETKAFLLYQRFQSADELENLELPPYKVFFCELRNKKPLDKDFKEHQNLRSCGFDEQQDLKKLKTLPAFERENYNYFQKIQLKKLNCLFSKMFCHRTTTKMLFQPLKRCNKIVSFCHQKKIDSKSTIEKFNQFCKSHKKLCLKNKKT